VQRSMTRPVGSLLVAASMVIGMQASRGDTPPPQPLLPLATCTTRVTDGPGDGVPVLNPVDVSPVPAVGDPRGNVAGLDITSITLRATATRVYAFMALTDIPDTLRQTDSAYGYTVFFKRGAKFARFENVYANAALQPQGLAPTTGLQAASVGATTTAGDALTGVGGGVDKAKNVAYVYADRASFEAKTGGELVDGEEITAISGRTELWETDGKTAPGVARRPADTTDAAPAAAVWLVGDESCFPATAITAPAVTAQYGDPVTLTATVKDAAGTPIADRTVSATVPGESEPRTLTTDAAGEVRIALAAAPVAGTYEIKVTYPGDDTSGRGEGIATLTVRAETIRVAVAVKKAGTARTVTATLTEDDPTAFAKQPVVWYVNGKKVASGTTDAAGRAVYKGAKAGQSVQARYAGLTGRYAAAASPTVKA
jgi:hypothetical protein